MTKEDVEFNQLLEDRLTEKLASFLSKSLTSDIVRQIRNSFKHVINTTCSEYKLNLSEEAVVWVTDQYFKSIKINDNLLMNEQVVINEYQLTELDLGDIVLLYSNFGGSSFGDEITKEFNKRTMS